MGGVRQGGVRRGGQRIQGTDLGEESRACHKSFSFEESQALISSKPWQGDPISSFVCVLEAQRGTETASEAQRPWVWPLSLAWLRGPCLGTGAEGEAPGSLRSGLWAWWELGGSLCPSSPGCLLWAGQRRCRLQGATEMLFEDSLVDFLGPIRAEIIKIWLSAGLRAALASPSFSPSSEKRR